MRVDQEVDYHGYTAVEMLGALEMAWARRSWQGLRRVRVIHGSGCVLWRELRRWADEKGIPWSPEVANPGTTILHPALRVVPAPAPAHRPIGSHSRSLGTALARRCATHPLPPGRPMTRPAPRDAAPPAESQPEGPAHHPDAMAEEFDRLAAEDARALWRRKHSRRG
jgi:hypothetical protein